MIVDRFGRKILLILSGGFMSFSLIGLAVFFFIQRYECSESENIPIKIGKRNGTLYHKALFDDSFFAEIPLEKCGLFHFLKCNLPALIT